MSAIAAVAESAVAPPASERRRELEAEVIRMVRSSARGDVSPSATSAPDGHVVSIAAAARTAAGERTLMASSQGVHLAADASLVKRAELADELARTGSHLPGKPDDADLLLAAWQAWGEGMVRRVEGDVAVVVWDEQRKILAAWRDYVGRRPLHWTMSDGMLLAASTPGMLLAHPRTARALNREGLAAIAGALLEHPDETAWTAIRILPPGHLLTWSPGSELRVRRVWEPPEFERGPALPFQEARSELRRLLVRAVSDRMSDVEPTAVWMSGGWDSPAVFGAARAADAGAVIPVSMSYPKGDRGREDEIISAIARFHRAEVTWASVDDAPLVLRDVLAEVPTEDGPFVHPYRWWNRRLAEVTSAAGAHMVLDGAGGDQLFGLTPVFIADLLRQGRVLEARRAARAHGVVARSGRPAWEGWWQWGIRPLLPPVALRAIGLVRGGRTPLGHLERAVPRWLVRSGGLGETLRRRARGWDPRRGESLGASESRWYLTSGYSGRILAAQSAAALEGGVVLRSPLLDASIIRLAATRPRVERAAGGETKRLLRAAASEWLPASVLAKRDSRTGLSTDYFRRELRMSLPLLLKQAGGMEALAGLDVVDPASVRSHAEDWLAGRAGDEHGMALLCTLRAELWARAWLGDAAVAVAQGRSSPA
jgi:asparagine synthase (glutamine-hydrolysing)